MTLMPVETSPVVRMISKAAQIDPEGTAELVRLALYESLCDQVDAAAPYLERDLDEFITKRDETIKRTLVREYVAKRQAGEDVTEVLEAAAKFTVVSKEVTLQGAGSPDNPKTRFWDARDKLGRFASAMGAGDKGRGMNGGGPFDRPRYSNMRATGEALATLSGSPQAQAIGGTLSAVGQLGPEAEKVLGNGLRRTSYRYRGTEKRPNKTLKNDVKSGLKIIDPDPAVQATVARALASDKADSVTGRALAGRPFDKDRSSVRAQEGVSPSVAIATFHRDRNISQDSKEMRIAGDIAANYYLDKLPDPESVAISIAAGAVPPSQGVIIDADGDIVSEAMGINGDHYVPFDLKNLRSLNGGQYVRTRAVGGPTTEDIYTGLLSGARQVQVVSQSGVFTMEFDPDLRGGRRYSDKARQMVGRYQQILNAIDKSKEKGLYQVDLSPKEKREIYQSVAQDYTDEDEIKAVADRRINAARAQRSHKMLTDDEILAEAKSRLRTGDNRGELKNLVNEVREENRAASVKRFQLDGDGYEAALNALKTEFPYFVREVRREKLPDFVEVRGLQKKTKFSGATDQGYVSPGDSATAGIARAALSNNQVGQRMAASRKKPGATTETSDATEGATEAPGATPDAPKAAGSGPKLKEALKDPAFKANVGLSYANLGQVAKTFNIDPGYDAAIQEDMDWAQRMPADARIGLVHRRADKAGGNFIDFINDSKNTVMREKYMEALPELMEAVEDYGLPQNTHDMVEEAVTKVIEAQEIMEPFADGDVETYDPRVNKNKPLRFTAIENLATDKEAFDKFEHALTLDDKRAALADEIKHVEEIDPVDRVAHVSDAIAKLRTVKADDPDRARIKGEVERAQIAYSYVAAKEKAKRFAELANKEWEVGKALAPSAGASSPGLTWHRPGSVVATEFQKFLRQRQGSGPSRRGVPS